MNAAGPAEKTFIEEKISTEAKPERFWHVIAVNDPVNLMSYVVMVLRKVFGYNQPQAKKHMLEIHKSGKSILWSGERETAENYVYILQKWQINAILQKDERDSSS